MFSDGEADAWTVNTLEKELWPYRELAKTAKHGWFWHVGTHPEFGYTARVWKRNKDYDGKTVLNKYLFRMGTGKSIEEAVKNLFASETKEKSLNDR